MSVTTNTTPRERLIEVLAELDGERVRQLARTLLEENSYYDEHGAVDPERVEKFPCTGRQYHLCSFTLRHSEECERGQPTPHPSENDPERTTPACPVPCEGPLVPWCDVSGHDCPDCETVAYFRAVLASYQPSAEDEGQPPNRGST